MNQELLKRIGNIEQAAGIREAVLQNGPGAGLRIAELHNAAGLRFTVVPDHGMDIYDFSYKGVNLSFLSKNGLNSAAPASGPEDVFFGKWPAGMLSTCGLDNVNGSTVIDGVYYPTHGKISSLPAEGFSASEIWEGDRYLLRTEGEMNETDLYHRHLSLHRKISTGLYDKTVTITDTITNFQPEPEPYMILYHFNFGWPLLSEKAKVFVSSSDVRGLNPGSKDFESVTAPENGYRAQAFFRTGFGKKGCAALVNPELELGVWIDFDPAVLPNLVEWKNFLPRCNVLSLEPTNTFPGNREDALKEGTLPMLSGFGSVTGTIHIGILDGKEEINSFLSKMT